MSALTLPATAAGDRPNLRAVGAFPGGRYDVLICPAVKR